MRNLPAIFLLIVLFLGLLILNPDIYWAPEPATTQNEETIKLPEGWAINESQEESVVFSAALQDKADNAFASTVLVREPKTVSDPDNYTYTLMMGAYKTIPSLTYLKDTINKSPGRYLRDLEGNYSLGGEEAYLWQQIYVGKSEVFVLTSSYSDPAFRPQIDRIVGRVKKRYSLMFQ